MILDQEVVHRRQHQERGVYELVDLRIHHRGSVRGIRVTASPRIVWGVATRAPGVDEYAVRRREKSVLALAEYTEREAPELEFRHHPAEPLVVVEDLRNFLVRRPPVDVLALHVGNGTFVRTPEVLDAIRPRPLIAEQLHHVPQPGRQGVRIERRRHLVLNTYLFTSTQAPPGDWDEADHWGRFEVGRAHQELTVLDKNKEWSMLPDDDRDQ